MYMPPTIPPDASIPSVQPALPPHGAAPFPPPDAAVATWGLTRSFGPKIAVNGLNLAVRRGEFFGFLGPNGAGKSTTIKMMVGLLRPSFGTAFIDGVDVWRDPRSEEHTSELQSQSNLVCRLLLE